MIKKDFRIKTNITNFANLNEVDEENLRIREKELKIIRIGMNLKGVLRDIYREVSIRTKT